MDLTGADKVVIAAVFRLRMGNGPIIPPSPEGRCDRVDSVRIRPGLGERFCNNGARNPRAIARPNRSITQ